MNEAQWDAGLALKLHGARRLTICAWPALKQAEGSVVLMSGNSAVFPKASYAAGSTLTCVATVTIVSSFPNAWAAEAGGSPAMSLPLAFLVKDAVLLSALIHLLKQDVSRSVASTAKSSVQHSSHK
jgi:hypothetical protein